MWCRENLKTTSCQGHNFIPEYGQISKTFWYKLFFFGHCNKKCDRENLQFLEISTYNHGETVQFRENLNAILCLGRHSAPENVQNSSTFWKKNSCLLASVIIWLIVVSCRDQYYMFCCFNESQMTFHIVKDSSTFLFLLKTVLKKTPTKR